MIDPPHHIVLASASPRRLALLQAAGFQVTVRASHVDETWPGGAPLACVEALARRKLAAVGHAEHITVAADTAVLDGDTPLGKPADAAAAIATLERLAGRAHQVCTGWAVGRGHTICSGAVRTEVHLRPLLRADIARYVATGESLDKAGAYGIQGGGGALVEWVQGSYTNVVGLPLTEVLKAIAQVAEATPAP